jgi:hypothetical protein
MTSTFTHPRPTANPVPIIVAAFVATALVVLVLAFTVWDSDGGEIAVQAPTVDARSSAGSEATAAQHYRDRLQQLNTTYDRYDAAVAAPGSEATAAQQYRDRLQQLNTTYDRYDAAVAAPGSEATAAQHYRDRLQELNTTYDGYDVAVAAPGSDHRAASCGLTGPC